MTREELQLAKELADDLEINGHPENLCVKASRVMHKLIEENQRRFAPPHWEMEFNDNGR
jgi:hypothetical protein